MARARELEHDPAAAALPLYGVPFAIKDNIDLAGVADHGGLSRLRLHARSAARRWWRRCSTPGAIPIGKTNLDQFATGLVGTRRLRRVLQRVRCALHFGRIELRLGGGGGAGAGELFAGHGHGGVGPRSRGVQQSGRAEAYARAAEHRGRGARLPDARLRFDFRDELQRCANGLDARRKASIARDPYSRVPGTGTRTRRRGLGGPFPLRRARRRTSWNSSATRKPRRCIERRWRDWKRWAA